MIFACTRIRWTDGTSMVLRQTVICFENEDLVSQEAKNLEVSCSDWESESMELHEKLCERILAKTKELQS
jgi:hypothetical protein